MIWEGVVPVILVLFGSLLQDVVVQGVQVGLVGVVSGRLSAAGRRVHMYGVCVPTGWMGRRRSVLVGGTRGREEYKNVPESCEEFYFARLLGVGAAIWR